MADQNLLKNVSSNNDVLTCTVCARGIPLPSKMDLPEGIVTNRAVPTKLALAVKTKEGEMKEYKWKDGSELVVKFLYPTQSMHKDYASYHVRMEKMVRDVAPVWQTCTNIKFKFVNHDSKEVPHIMLTFMTNSEVDAANLSRGHYGQWSYLGQECQGLSPSMNLNYVDILKEVDSTSTDPKRKKYLDQYMYATILHEFGHALGFIHEHLRGDRGDKIELDIDAIVKFNKENSDWDEKKTRDNINDVWKMDYLKASTLDLKSIMIYLFEAWKLKSGGGKVAEIEAPTELSDVDKSWARIIYPPIKKV